MLPGIKWTLNSYLSGIKGGSRKIAWRLRNSGVTETRPVFIFGSQRSGTGMLGACLGSSPEIQNFGESDPRAFAHFSLKDDQTVLQVIRDCRFPYLVLKPLKDSHRVKELITLDSNGRAIWAFRNYLDRINSAVRQFGRHPLDVFESFAAGNCSHWQLQGMSESVARVLRSFNFPDLNAHEGAALMWWVRNSLYFEQELPAANYVRLWSYDEFVRDPEREFRRILEYLGAGFHPFMLEGVHAQSVGKEERPTLRKEVTELCQSLYERLVKASSLANT